MTTPAGWYPDPEYRGWQRYWDGAAWTEHWAALYPAPQQAHKGTWFGRHKVLTGLAAAFVVLLVLAGIGSALETTPVNEATSGSPGSDDPPAATPTPEDEAAETDKPRRDTAGEKKAPTPEPTTSSTPEDRPSATERRSVQRYPVLDVIGGDTIRAPVGDPLCRSVLSLWALPGSAGTR